MKCLILAAGYATRLYPLTENFPKPLLEVGGKTILDWLIGDIDRCGMIDEYIVISNGKFAPHFEKWARGNIRVVNDNTFTNETRLGAVRDIEFALKKLDIDDELLVMAGDNLLDFSLCTFIEYYRKKKASCVMRFNEPDESKLLKCGVVSVDENDRIVKMTEKSPNPESHWVCPPFYIYTKEDARLISQALEEGCGYDAPGSFVAWLCEKRKVYSMEMPGKRYDIGNLESYEMVKNEYIGIK